MCVTLGSNRGEKSKTFGFSCGEETKRKLVSELMREKKGLIDIFRY
jgi:hypothetical protein